MNNFPLPDDSHLEKLIEQVFELNYRPEQEKLDRLEELLLLKIKRRKPVKKLNKTPWWIVLLLTGGLATAAWWAGDILIDIQNKKVSEERVFSDNVIGNDMDKNVIDPGHENNNDNDESYENRESPVIYQRESF